MMKCSGTLCTAGDKAIQKNQKKKIWRKIIYNLPVINEWNA